MLSISPCQELLAQRYRIQNVCSSTILSREYLALDVKQLNQPCLLKELVLPLDADAAKQQRIEIQRRLILLYQLKHPQVLSFRGVFEHEQRLFLVQDFLRGKTYRTVLQERQAQNQCFSELEVLQLCTRLLPVLVALHEVGIVHHNIHPDSLLVNHQPSSTSGSANLLELPILTNFSLTLSDRDSFLSHPATDLYGLGMTCLELLTGKASSTLLNKSDVLMLDPELQVSHRTLDFLKKMVASNAKERYLSAAAAQRDLQNLLTERSFYLKQAADAGCKSKTSQVTEHQPTWSSRSLRVNLEAIISLLNQSKSDRTTISIGAGMLTLLSLMSFLGRPILPHANDGVWISGIHVPQAEVSSIISTPDPEEVASLPVLSSSAYFNTVIETDRAQATDLDLNQLPLRVQSTLQTSSQFYRFTPDQAQQLTVTLQSTDTLPNSAIKMVVLPASSTQVVEKSSSHWAGNLPAGEPCVIQVIGSGSFVLSLTASSQ